MYRCYTYNSAALDVTNISKDGISVDCMLKLGFFLLKKLLVKQDVEGVIKLDTFMPC
jgi:hypothetical protein